jgi:uncharacterized DUF497 family protein
VSFDGGKDRINRRKHGISLARAAEFDFDSCLYIPDDRELYPDGRVRAVGFLDAILYMLVFVPIGPDAIHAISLRKAKRSERNFYDEET